MPIRKSLKFIITEAVLAQLPNRNSHKTFDEYINLWWYTKHGNGLRLTPRGNEDFICAEIEYFDLPFKITMGDWYKFIVKANKKLRCPYFIGMKKKDLEKNEPYIRLFDSKIAMLVSLYGNVTDYLESVK